MAGCRRNVSSVGGNGGKFNFHLLFRSYIGAAPKSDFHCVCMCVGGWEAVIFALKTDLSCCVILSCVNIGLDYCIILYMDGMRDGIFLPNFRYLQCEYIDLSH